MTTRAGSLNLHVDFENGITDVDSKQIMDAIVAAVTKVTQGEVTARHGGVVLIRKA
jgi:hypothetical protein